MFCGEKNRLYSVATEANFPTPVTGNEVCCDACKFFHIYRYGLLVLFKVKKIQNGNIRRISSPAGNEEEGGKCDSCRTRQQWQVYSLELPEA